ncbi:proline--tRNA ligase [Candidatus Saccharibacteria bacterium]|nr:proline--tRNA ligase [Candidatus Saccharibacteria bacterium]
MKRTQLFTKTSKTAPADEVARNAQLLIRAGFIHKEMAGAYAFLPLGLRVIEKIKNIVREEMNAIGGQETMMTALQPRELFERTNRWDDAVVDNWFKTELKSGVKLGLGLTHEEPFTISVGEYAQSYKDFPLFVYQIASKFRNELRAKSGILRCREFLMKDMYSFARSQTEHDELYEQAAAAYTRVYDRLGIGDITFRTKADGGYFTENYSDEYQTLSLIGEDTLFHVPGTDKWFNQEVAPSQAPLLDNQDKEEKPLENVEGEGVIGVNALAKMLGITPEQTTKTMLYVTDSGEVVAAAVRGGYDINEIKLRKVLNVKSLKLADEETVRKVTGAEIGYAGLLNLPKEVRVIVDESCANRTNFEMGGNQTNLHAMNVNWGRDLPSPEKFFDIKTAKEGDLDPETGQIYEVERSIEAGNIFPLESKYTDALDVYYTDEKGERQSIIMGCYGIGISRVMGIIAEVFADDRGLVWPKSVAPFQVYLINIGDDEEVLREATAIYKDLQVNGAEVIWDDRPEARPGEKFADADLMGIPWRVVVSAKTLNKNGFELKARASDETLDVGPRELILKILGQEFTDENVDKLKFVR